MSEESQNTNPETEERALLLSQARMMGLNVSNNIGTDKLKERISAHLEESSAQSETDTSEEELGEHATPHDTSIGALRKKLRAEAMALVRVQIANLDPKKASLQGEIFTIHNDIVGTVKRFVPYGDITEDGWHIEQIIYEELKSRKFQHIRTYTDKVTKQIQVEKTMRNEFSFTKLPALTKEELQDLRIAQTGK